MDNFVDIDINFDRNPSTGDIYLRKEEEAVKRSLRNLVLYGVNDKPFHPEISSGLQDMLFENQDPLILSELRTTLENIIANYEPRVKTANINVVNIIDTNTIRITIDFTITNINRLFSTTIALERLR